MRDFSDVWIVWNYHHHIKESRNSCFKARNDVKVIHLATFFQYTYLHIFISWRVVICFSIQNNSWVFYRTWWCQIIKNSFMVMLIHSVFMNYGLHLQYRDEPFIKNGSFRYFFCTYYTKTDKTLSMKLLPMSKVAPLKLHT